ncbi:MAG: hypothetical protein P0Y64_16655 [Candidatus Sphingomonas colombiensis]|nr:hypothetical protein [Sphingomonas sp.]WEK42950.1 MAG: hypothetical protein P0Y64_16655 [Sphingomonas sp.]
MATVLKLTPARDAATICRDLRDARASVDAFVSNAPNLNDDQLAAWDRLDDRIFALRAELDAMLLDQTGVSLGQIREAMGC